MQPPSPEPHLAERLLGFAYRVVYAVVAVLFALCAAGVVVFAVVELWQGAFTLLDVELSVRFDAVLETLGMLSIAVAALELSQSVWREGVLQSPGLSAQARVRRLLSRFLLVVVAALAVQALTLAYRFAHDDPESLAYVADIAFGAAALLVAWGLFVRLNRATEVLEGEAPPRAEPAGGEHGAVGAQTLAEGDAPGRVRETSH
jgi:hypothetical protein